MKQLLPALLTNALLVATSTATAGSLYCAGTVKDVYTEYNGQVSAKMSYRNHYTRICGTQTQWHHVPIDVCKDWSDYLTAAKLTGSIVRLAYADSIISCDQIPTYGNAPAPYYIMLQEG